MYVLRQRYLTLPLLEIGDSKFSTPVSHPMIAENMGIQEDASEHEKEWREAPPVEQSARVLRIPKPGESRWNSKCFCT